ELLRRDLAGTDPGGVESRGFDAEPCDEVDGTKRGLARSPVVPGGALPRRLLAKHGLRTPVLLLRIVALVLPLLLRLGRSFPAGGLARLELGNALRHSDEGIAKDLVHRAHGDEGH